MGNINSIEIMVAEHDNILRFNNVVRRACLGILEGKDVCAEDFRSMVEFVRNYADKYHHGKEEQILFKEMTAHLGQIGTNLITHGMLVEHDLARLYISELETALDRYHLNFSVDARLDIIAAAVGYTKLLKRHIDKENSVVYPYAEKRLPEEVLESINARAETFEIQAEKRGTQKKYLDVLAMLESKYL